MFLVTLDEKAAAEVAYKWILEPRAEVRHRLRQDTEATRKSKLNLQTICQCHV